MKFVNYILVFVSFISLAYAGIPKPEYPRPQFERNDWINLNGTWTYQLDPVRSGFERGNINTTGFDSLITVPFAPESMLSGVQHKDFISRIWYHRSISVPASWSDKSVILHFGAVYYESEVYIDGKFVGRHHGGSSSFSYDITRFVKTGKMHNLVVVASSDLRSGLQTAGKQSLQWASHNCNYTRTTGIWQTVWMEGVDEYALKSLHVMTDIDQQQVAIKPTYYHQSTHRLTVHVRDNGKTVATRTVAANNSSVIVIPIKDPKLWSPESPFLYDLELLVTSLDGQEIDKISSYFGMRKIHVEGNRIYLNNQAYYQRLVLDQGFYPDGIWTSPSDEALKRDIMLGKEAGFNGARLHQKVFEERYYYWADKLGYLTWGESASWGMDANNIEAARNFISEWMECVERDRNHPSLVIWTPFNEQWWPDKTNYPRLAGDIYQLTKLLDPTRPVNGVSGGAHILTDIWTVHHYEQDPEKLRDIFYSDGKYFQTPNEAHPGHRNIGFNEIKDNNNYIFPVYDGQKPYFVDEFGGIKWVSDEKLQQLDSKTQTWGYGDAPRTLDEFYQRLEGQVDQVLSLSEQIWGYCYTQLTDVEQEQNGIYNYDRSTKFDMEKIKKIFSKEP